MLGVDRLVAVDEIRLRQQMQEVVGAGAADDALGVEAEGAADGFAQIAGGAVRVVLKMRPAA